MHSKQMKVNCIVGIQTNTWCCLIWTEPEVLHANILKTAFIKENRLMKIIILLQITFHNVLIFCDAYFIVI